MMRYILFFGAVLLTFTACNSGSGVSTAVSDAGTGNAAHDMLSKLDVGARASALGGIVASSGDRCRGKDAFFMGSDPKDNEAYWSVRCTNGKSYEVAIKANATGSTSIMDCAALKAVADVDCFVKLSDKPNPPRTKKQIKADLERLSPALKKQLTDRLRGM
jgi:hypothetical protein